MKRVVGIILVMMLLLNGCALLPQEEEMRKAPVGQSVDEEYFETAEAKIGSVTDYVQERCTYQYQEIQNLSFSNTDKVKETYVVVGQKVHAGELLAEQKVESIEEALELESESLKLLEKEVSYYEAKVSIELERQDLAKRYGKKYDDTRLKDLQAQLEHNRNSYDLANLRIGEYEAELSKRQIISGIDGIVDYVKEFNMWDNGTARANDRYITVHSEKTGFVFSTRNFDIYNFGDVHEITTDTGTYECEVVKIKKTEKSDMATIVMQPLNPDENLYVGAGGELIIETAREDNVLYVPTAAIRVIDEKDAVYVSDENGLRKIRFVEIGLSISNKLYSEENRTVIVSGLEAGDKVIVH